MEEITLLEYLESPEFLSASTNATRLVSKLKSAVQRDELYETHQILRTIHFRFINSVDKILALKNLLYCGSCHLLKAQEYVSGQDIGVLFLDTCARCLQTYKDAGGSASVDLNSASLLYHSTGKTLSWEVSLKAAEIAILIPDTDIGQRKFIADILKILTPTVLNRNLLHEVLAIRFWRSGDFPNSRFNYLHCATHDNAKDIADLLIEYQTGRANKHEVDLFLTQFILQFLCLQTPFDPPAPQKKAMPGQGIVVTPKTRSVIKSIAKKIFTSYLVQHSQLSHADNLPYSSFPLLNFTYFIISILDSNQDADTFTFLCDAYKPAWSRDPNYKSYLTRIGTLYFGIADPAAQRQGGLLNNMLLSLFETGDDEDGSTSPGETSPMDDLD